jgi:nitrate reductase NapE component
MLAVKIFPSASVSFVITDDAVVVVRETVPPSFTCIISVAATGGSFTWLIVMLTVVFNPLANPSLGA